MEEIWKDIEGYEGRYQVSNLGRIKSFLRVGVRKDVEILDDYSHIIKPVHEISGNQGGISPKFKVGDWVVWNCLICEIKDISKDGYHCHNAFIPFAQEGDIIPCDDIEAKEIIRSNKIINAKILEGIDPHFLKIEPEKCSPNTQPLSLG